MLTWSPAVQPEGWHEAWVSVAEAYQLSRCATQSHASSLGRMQGAVELGMHKPGAWALVPCKTSHCMACVVQTRHAPPQLCRPPQQGPASRASVQAMALQHKDGIELACNLLDSSRSTCEHVLAAVKLAVSAEGGMVVSSYRIGRPVSDAIAAWAQANCSVSVS